jgi:hypothetical protein
MGKSGYVCAGFETMGSFLDKFFMEKSLNDCFSKETLNNFFLQTCNKFLHSFGASFSGRKKYDKYAKQEAKLFRQNRDYGFFNDCTFIVDSGGFQASIGSLDKKETNILYDIYYNDFLVNHKDVYDRAFVLDIPPGPGCKIFSSFDDVYEMNHKSYMKAVNLPDDVRDKMIYIHHFRTPKLWEIYTRIMDENDLFDKFKYHATGGIVANMASDTAIPCVIYILPLIPLLARAKKYSRKKLYFHILGGAQYRDVFFYELFKIHVMKVHGIELEITYDSSGILKGLMQGRIIPILMNGKLTRIDLRTFALDGKQMGLNDDRKVIEIYKSTLNELCKFGFKEISVDKVYSEETGSFLYDIMSYTMLYMLYIYSKAEDYLKGVAAEIYKLYEAHNSRVDQDDHEDIVLFNKEVYEIIRNMNEGKVTKKAASKSNSVSTSLDMLTDLDEDFCKHIVTKFLSKDEFISLSSDKFLTF